MNPITERAAVLMLRVLEDSGTFPSNGDVTPPPVVITAHSRLLREPRLHSNGPAYLRVSPDWLLVGGDRNRRAPLPLEVEHGLADDTRQEDGLASVGLSRRRFHMEPRVCCRLMGA